MVASVQAAGGGTGCVASTVIVTLRGVSVAATFLNVFGHAIVLVILTTRLW